MIRRKLFLLCSIVSIFCNGCLSNRHMLSINAAYPFEGRYDSSSTITINQDKIRFQEKDSIWILSNHTLYNLLTSVSDSKDKVIFKSSKRDYLFSGNFDKEITNITNSSTSSFDDEEYVWDSWIQSKNED